MNDHFLINVDETYKKAELEAIKYYQLLYNQVVQKDYIPKVKNDLQLWQKSHNPSKLFTLFSKGTRKPSSKDFHHYIKWLDYTGRLQDYLERSVSYIFLRDLGKELTSIDTQQAIERVVENIKNYLTQSKNSTESFNIATLYRWAQKEKIEPSIIWLINRLRTVSNQIPGEMDALNAERKLIKIITGVLMHQYQEMDGNLSPENRAQQLERAIRLGYSYGLTYPFIDDLLDSKLLNKSEEKHFSHIIRTALTTGTVPNFEGWSTQNIEFMGFVHSELRDAFDYIKSQQRNPKSFFEQAYVFFTSQEVDRLKDLSNGTYTNEELYIPIILKSSSSRLIARSLISAPDDKGFNNRTFLYGIYNQLADDFADIFDDMENNSVTPYTYYLKYHDKRMDLINPFEMYWAVISNLIHHVYHSDKKTCDVILNRAINSMKRFKERAGNAKYNEILDIFLTDDIHFNKLLQKLVNRAENVDFLDKLIRDSLLDNLKIERTEKEDFEQTIQTISKKINNELHILDADHPLQLKEPIITAANYSLESGGKRLRPILTWYMGVKGYGLKESIIFPLLKSLEYMHTASLIFDDLPSQDHASTRRGRQTLHEVYNVAIAELTALFLTQKAVEEQVSLELDAKSVLQMVQYSAQKTAEMCRGQAMDLDSKGKLLTLEELNMMCFYKTGIAFEASLIMPAILANAGAAEIEALKKYARHAGIAFQIKDDLLDVEGDSSLLGKPIGQDVENHNSTFVTILGAEGAKIAMWEHYCLAEETLQEIPVNTTFLKHFLNYIVLRDR